MSQVRRKTTARAVKAAPVITNVDPTAFPDQYGMRVDGDCMSPEFDDGDLLWFDKNEPIEPGDNVIIFLRPEIVPPGAHQARVKRLVLAIPRGMTFPYEEHPDSMVTPCIVAEMNNPPRKFIVKCSDVLAVHRCMGILPADRRRPGLAVPPPRLRHTEQHVSASWPEQYVEAMGGIMAAPMSRRSVTTGLAALPLAAVGATVRASDPDPIFTAIDTHRAAQGFIDEFCARTQEMPDDEARLATLCDIETDAAWAMLDVEPTTVAGVAALLHHIGEHAQGGRRGWPERAKREDEPGPDWSSVSFEEDVIVLAARALDRMTGSANG